MIRSNSRAALAAGLLALVAAAEAGAQSASPVVVATAAGPDSVPRQPQAAVAPDGRVYVAFGVGDAIRVAASADGGRSFDSPKTVDPAGVMSLGMRRGPRIAATADAVVVAAVIGDQGKGKDGDVLSWRSADGGASWSGPRRVNAVEGAAREGLHALAAGPKGELFCAWLDLRDGRSEVYGARSADGGTTWEPDALVYRSPEGAICPCCHPSAAFGPDGALYVMWRNALAGKRDMYIARSEDGGRTFGPAEKLGQGAWELNACPMDGGAIAPGPGGRVDTVWMRAGSVFAARAGDRGRERRLGPGVQPWAAPGPDGPVAAWLVSRPGRLMAQSPGDEAPVVLADSANDPAIAGPADGKGPVVLTWEGPGDRSIRAAVLAPRR